MPEIDIIHRFDISGIRTVKIRPHIFWIGEHMIRHSGGIPTWCAAGTLSSGIPHLSASYIAHRITINRLPLSHILLDDGQYGHGGGNDSNRIVGRLAVSYSIYKRPRNSFVYFLECLHIFILRRIRRKTVKRSRSIILDSDQDDTPFDENNQNDPVSMPNGPNSPHELNDSNTPKHFFHNILKFIRRKAILQFAMSVMLAFAPSAPTAFEDHFIIHKGTTVIMSAKPFQNLSENNNDEPCNDLHGVAMSWARYFKNKKEAGIDPHDPTFI